VTEANRLLTPALVRRLSELFPQASICAVRPLGPDVKEEQDESSKQIGYGRPLRIDLTLADHTLRSVVFHTVTANDFGHDRRSDRAAEMLLAYDTFPLCPRHVRALDVGAIAQEDDLISLQKTGEFYLLTEWAEGHVYAEDLRRVATEGVAQPLDVARAEELATYLVALHRVPGSHGGAYVRALRDLVGHGEGIAGIADGYPQDTAGAPAARLQSIERAALEWRFRLQHQVHRLRRTHGDFHPFNLVFDDRTGLTLLDTSRGSEGEPADDVACLSINFLFFGLNHRERWSGGLGLLWERFWATYLRDSENQSVLSALAPFFAWRALVLASPLWYPNLTSADRDRILGFAERALAAERFDPAWGAEAMR
jgi:hypothetical protein